MKKFTRKLINTDEMLLLDFFKLKKRTLIFTDNQLFIDNTWILKSFECFICFLYT